MERVCEELDEAKAEIEKLRAEYKSKADLSESLKKSHSEQFNKIQEASLRIEKQAQEINEKAEEISVLKETFEDVRRHLNEKESIIKHLTAANDKLRGDCDQKFKKSEDENKALVLALEEANGKNFDQEQQIRACKEEIEGLKRSLSVSQKKCLEAEKRAKGNKEAREREGVLLKLEEEKAKIEEQLKWKKEQFTHLEEAHKKMRDEFKESKEEWELEKSSLHDEICSLQTSLDSQTRILEDLQNRLQMYNQALAHEESRRKSLEVQLSDVQGRFENVFNEYEDAKSQLEHLTEKRNEEIASLRHSLGNKGAILKEMEYQKRQMEQENQELRISLKELQESQIKNASGSPSVAKLRNKLKCLEQMHRESTANLKAKEAELNSQLEKVTEDLNNYESQLERKDEIIKELMMELEKMREVNVNLRAKEAEWKSQLEKATNDLNNCMSELLESKDAIRKELEMEFQQIHRESAAKFKAQENEWKNQLEIMMGDLKKYRSQVESKEEINQLNRNFEKVRNVHSADLRAEEAEKNFRLEKVTSDLNNYRMESESREAMIMALRMELEQVHGDTRAKFEAQEAKWKHQLEMMTGDLSRNRSELENRDERMETLKKELENTQEDHSANLKEKESEWRYQLEMMTGDLNKIRSELENRDEMMKELKMEMEKMHEDHFVELRDKEAERNSQLENLTNDFHICRSELESRDATVKELRMGFEQIHGELFANLKTKEAEWDYQLEMMAGNLNRYRSEIVDKDARIEELIVDLEDCQSSSLQLKLQNEEISLMLLVLKDGISDAQLKIANEKAEMDQRNKDREQKISLLMQQLEMKSADIDRLHKDIREERENAASLSRKVESLDIVYQQQLLLQEDLDRYEEKLIESSTCELILREQILHMESVLHKKLREVCDDLDRTNTELGEKICEGNGIEFELYIWKSVAEQLKVELEENYEVRKELEASLLAQVDVGETIKQEKRALIHMLEEKEERISNLQQQIAVLEQNLRTREAGAYSRETEIAMSFETKKASFLQIIEEKDRILEQLRKEVGWLEQESLRRELEDLLLAKIEAERTIEYEKENLMQHVVEQKSRRVNDLMQLVESLENKFNSSLISLSSQLAEKQEEINLVHEAWEKITAAEIMAALEIEEKKLMIVELEEDIHNVQRKLEFQQKSMSYLKQQASEVEAKLEAKELEMKKLGDQLKTKLKNSDALIEELKSEKRSLLEEVTKLSSERENLLGFVGGLDDRISEFSSTDKQLMNMLETIILSCDNHGSQNNEHLEDEHTRTPKENVDSPLAMKKAEAISDVRSPFREINSQM
ncbi:hypothetical protein TIFTF001_004446 [Ficus carica]|uniref:Uncharacterized protein n=1 Tax=Ficus carica TaxID=3494 RepID=A0AA87ZKU9_FICCA|nr:hypothetical protein TIFTF001_004446 [Ficus carica]